VEERQKTVLKILEKTGPKLYALLAKLTLSQDMVGDLMQELFLRLLKSKGLDEARDPFAYAHRSAVNLAFEWRKKQKNKHLSLNSNLVTEKQNPSTINMIIERENLEKVLNATAKLKEPAREVVIMHYIEQQSYDQIALRMGKKPQHIRSICSKAMARIRETLYTEMNKNQNKEINYG